VTSKERKRSFADRYMDHAGYDPGAIAHQLGVKPPAPTQTDTDEEIRAMKAEALRRSEGHDWPLPYITGFIDGAIWRVRWKAPTDRAVKRVSELEHCISELSKMLDARTAHRDALQDALTEILNRFPVGSEDPVACIAGGALTSPPEVTRPDTAKGEPDGQQ
jgi:hypothetical protein